MNDNNHGRARVISIISGKGGVGKTTLVSNLSTILVHKFKKRVLAVDANITTANLGVHMGLAHSPTTLHDVLEDDMPIENAIYFSFGVDMIPAAHSIGNENALKKLRSKIRPLLPHYDFVLLDSSPGFGLEARLALRLADELLLVTNPDLSAVTEAIKMIELARKKDIPVIGIVLNRVAGRDYEVKPSEIEEACGEKVIAVIPEDILVQKSTSMRTPVVIYNPGCRASKAFEKLAWKLTAVETVKWEAGLLERLGALAFSIKEKISLLAMREPGNRENARTPGNRENARTPGNRENARTPGDRENAREPGDRKSGVRAGIWKALQGLLARAPMTKIDRAPMTKKKPEKMEPETPTSGAEDANNGAGFPGEVYEEEESGWNEESGEAAMADEKKEPVSPPPPPES